VFSGSFGIIYNPPDVPYFNDVPNGFGRDFKARTRSVLRLTGMVDTLASFDPTTLFPFPTSIDPRALRVGYSDAFNFGVQYELTPNPRVEASYVGNRGHRLMDTALAWNDFNLFASSGSVSFGSRCTQLCLVICWTLHSTITFAVRRMQPATVSRTLQH
jgi:hypothetical protein